MQKLKHPYSTAMLSLSLLIASLTACASENSYTKGADKPAVSPTKVSNLKKMNQQQQIEIATEDLASRLNIDVTSVSLAGIESVTWRSGAMGCPVAGMQYTEALVSGKLIMLNVEGGSYRYHSSRYGKPTYCPNERAESPAPNAGDI